MMPQKPGPLSAVAVRASACQLRPTTPAPSETPEKLGAMKLLAEFEAVTSPCKQTVVLGRVGSQTSAPSAPTWKGRALKKRPAASGRLVITPAVAPTGCTAGETFTTTSVC